MTVSDVRVSVTVPVPADVAFRVFAQRPGEWLPPAHTFLREPESIAIEPKVGGRFYERSAAGTEMIRGTVREWAPPDRLVLTWRVGANWRPVDSDDTASDVEIDFVAVGQNATEVVVTHTHLDRHGEFAAQLHGILAAENPGETLTRYVETVARHASDGPL